MPIPKSQPIKRETATDHAYQQIRSWLIDGTLEPGEKLAETALATAISISRTPVREALQRLATDGFVIMNTGQVTRVAPLYHDDVATLYQPMAAIEGLAAQLMVSKISPAERDELQKIDSRLTTALHKQYVGTELSVDRAFHEQVLAVADNPYLTQFSDFLYSHILRFETYFFSHHDVSIDINGRQHEALLSAIDHHNAEAAKQALTNDWLETMTQIQRAQEQDNN
ncbi:GntR family transcriptional regulator [Furfurilactobacillus milii]|uniref:GntR family transcriptional regulator n=1 Tax=Furfurilactobacillus milii TaxID=2888272 RepID=A0A6N9I3S8_9LACO|nr:GntR family transcriptional regulator [Furfurilactobacillus milii]MYV17499.1 GntR family transcriptional regulator [Furfurilactobacillus milii]